MGNTRGEVGKRTKTTDRGRTKAGISGKPGQLRIGRTPKRQQASPASELRRLRKRLKAESLQREATAEILRAVANAGGDAAHPLQVTVATTAKLFRASSVRIRLVEDGNWGGTFHVGRSSDAVQSAVPDAMVQIGGRNLPGTVVFENRQIHIPDLNHIPREMADWPGLPPARAAGARVISGTPLRRGNAAIGVLIVHRDRPVPFTTEELALLQSFADQAVIAIENGRLFNETKQALERQTATSDILRVISQSPTDVKPVFEAIAQTAVRLLRCDRAFIQRCDDRSFWTVAWCGPEGQLPIANTSPIPIDPAANFPSRAIVEKKTLHLPNWAAIELPPFERAVHERLGINSAIYMPLLQDGECIGLLAMAGTRANAFGAADIVLAESFRDQAVIAIGNARLFKDTQEALERQTATSDILKVIASSPSNVQPVFEAIATRANSLVGGFSATVFRFIDGMAHLMAFTPTTPEADAVLKSTFPSPVDSFAPFQMARDGEVTQVADTETLTDEILQISRARGFRSMLFAPLMNKGASIGLIAVTRLRPGTFSDHHVQLLRTFADQAVIAIENVRLFDEVQARTRDLTESLQQQTATADVLKVISRSVFDLQTVLDTLIESAYKLCGAQVGLLYLRGEEAFECKAVAGSGSADASLLFKGRPIRAGRGTAAERVILTGEVQSIIDFFEDPEMDPSIREAIRNAGESHSSIGQIRSTLAVPMTRDNAVIGVMVIGRSQTGPFPQRQIETLQTFADQAVIAIENARLFDEVQARTRELSSSLEELRTAQDRLIQTEKLASLGQLTAGIAHEIKNPLNFVNNFSLLSTELIDELNDLLRSAAVHDKIRDEIDELTQMLKGNLEKVVQHGNRADSIVKNMLLHSREGAGEQRPADINAIVEESLNLAYHGARAEKSGFNITLERDLDPAAGMIDLYPQEMTRVLLNLISNGFYAATKRREISDEGFAPSLTATTRNLGNRVEIRIRDNGTGIPAEVQQKMFNPFFTTKPAGEGTGLGLSMSHDIVVKQHGGKIEVDTEPGRFTEFIITLPRAAAKTKAGERN